MKKLILSLLLAFTATAGASAQTSVLSAYGGVESDLQTWGTSRTESYFVAVHISDASLVGKTVNGVRLPFSDVSGLTDAKAFIATAIKSKTTTMVDTVALTPQQGWVEVAFSTPYTIPAEGLYVGYTFTATSTNKAPVVVVSGTESDFSYMRADRTYRNWVSMGEKTSFQSAMEILIGGISATEASVSLSDVNGQINKATVMGAVVSNNGSEPITSIDYELDFNGTKTTAHKNFVTAIPNRIGSHQKFNFRLPAVAESGSYPVTMTITKVNDGDNTSPTPSGSATVQIFSKLAKRRALMEEYTGTWCGWCPRGFVGLEHLYSDFGDDFVGVSIHQGDPMECVSIPSKVTGFPAAFINRIIETDAYLGNENNGRYAVDKVYSSAASAFCPADISVKANFTDDTKSTLEATASVTFTLDQDAASRYQLLFYLAENGMNAAGDKYTGSSSEWNQSNYYSGGASSWPDEDMKEFTGGASEVEGLTFNFVAIAQSGANGIANSIPDVAKEGVPVEYTYKFNADNCKNVSGNPVVQDKGKLYVVAALIDSKTGEVVNCNRASVLTKEEAAGISSVSTTVERHATSFYTIDGQRLSKPRKGLNIVRMSDGTAKKVMVK